MLPHLLTIAALVVPCIAYEFANYPPSWLPPDCANALATNITCPDLFSASFIARQPSLGLSILEEYCSADCTDSLLSFQAQVNQACGTREYSFPGDLNQTMQEVINPYVWAHKVACLKKAHSSVSGKSLTERLENAQLAL